MWPPPAPSPGAPAQATTPLAWAGASTSANWSDPANWTGTAPTANRSFGLVTFPALSDACTTGGTNQTCYTTTNDLAGLTLTGLNFNNHGDCSLSGSGFTLGASGISVTGGNSVNDPRTATFTAPIALGTDQRWNVGAFSFSGLGELQLLGSSPQQLNYTSANAVNFDADGGVIVNPTGTLELGPLTVDDTLLQLGQPNNYGTTELSRSSR